ncbi:RNA-directed DNA polymerase, eukaryota [Tanacetum coccineum]
MSSGRVCISTRSHKFVSEKVLVEIHGETFEAQVHELEKVKDSIEENSLDDLNDNLNDVAHDIQEDVVHMDKAKDTYTDKQYEYMENKENNEPSVSRVSESSDPNYPPGFEFMKRSSSNTSLIDLLIGGHFFSWMNKAGTKLSKLDRFLISEEVLEVLPDSRITALDRLLSDHTPLLFNVWPIPFKLYNS